MASSLSVKVDLSSLNGLARDLEALPAALAAGVVRGLNSTISKVRDDTVNTVTGQVNLSRAYVNPRVEVSSRAREGRPSATVSAPVRETLLTRFGATALTPRGAGVAVAVRAGGEQKTLRHAFIMKLRSANGFGVFVRPKGGGKPKALYGPSIYQVAQRTWREDEVKISAKLADTIADEIAVSTQEALKTK